MNKRLIPIIALLVIIAIDAHFASGAVLIDRIVATVNHEVVTESDLQAEAHLGEPVPREQLLKQVIENKIILQAAEREGMRVSSLEFEEALQDLQARNRFATREAFRDEVIKADMSWEKYIADLKIQMTMMKLMRREIEPDLFVTDGEIKSFYDGNLKKFQREQVRIKQILLPIPQDATSEAIDTILKNANQIESEIKNGTSFEQMETMAISHGGEASDLGLFKKGELSPEIGRVVFNLGIGEVSETVQTAIGFHIFKVLDKIGAMASLEESHAEISAFLLAEKRETQTRAWLSGIKKRTRVEIK
jgi:parvulin-like peptidyl-prolyl isomerase